ncbi:30S ribosomal protein S3 [Candidatus Pacearchaeota archaeon]|uniref:30S ribosomal protein S3 n=1 Tax=uncultured organism TaxID=155900 RepID=U3GWE6_9ZZZZ|nr:30S ribosomal protein S3 [uncultured organism]AJS12547.1 30S ribosomal protein S3 [uncultured archaeon]MBS3088316.1 30S ribosomal protein S3 [Candidatus Pacearchaeota archaeon]
MEEKKFVTFKKEEFGVKEYIINELGKGRISSVTIEYTPVGEKIVVATSKPGQVIGRKGEKIDQLTRFLKKRFKLDNPHIEIKEIIDSSLDAQLVADDIALMLERKGSLKFKVIAYKMLQQIMKSGAMGAELVLSGKLPSERARSWRFSQGYLKKTGDPAKVVDKAQAQATTALGVVGVKVFILPPNAHIHDRIIVDKALTDEIKVNVHEMHNPPEKTEEKSKETAKKKSTKKKEKKE